MLRPRLFASVTVWVAAAACGSPVKPSATVAAAQPVSPPTGTQISFYSQPVRLTFTSGVSTGAASLTDTVQLATDAAMTNVVATRPITTGQTSTTLDPLTAGKDYYWRVQTTGNGATAISPVFKFTIGPQLVLQPPAPVQPLTGSYSYKRPTFVVTDATRTGPVAVVSYQFVLATDAGFANIVSSGTVPETPTQTSFTPSSNLISGTTYYWRAQAVDTTTGITSGYSSPQAFTTVNPDDGTYRYDLTLHLVSASGCTDWYGRPTSPPPFPDVTFDNGLAVNGDSLRWGPVPYNPVTAGLTLNGQRSGAQVSGSLIGAAPAWPGTFGFFTSIKARFESASEDNTGRVTGTATGSFTENGFPAYYDCLTATIAFALTPHP